MASRKPVRFKDRSVDRQGLLSLGFDQHTGCRYLSIPVSNCMVDYEEHYGLTEDEYERFHSNQAEARLFAQECRARLHDDRLILKPGTDRGIPR